MHVIDKISQVTSAMLGLTVSIDNMSGALVGSVVLLMPLFVLKDGFHSCHNEHKGQGRC